MKDIAIETYQEILETINDGIRIFNNKGIILYANQALCTLLGYDKNEMIGMSISDFYPAADRQLADKRSADRSPDKSCCYETCFITKAGRKLYANVSEASVFSDQGKHIVSLSIIHDISERKKIEKDLVEKTEFLNNLISLCPDGIIGVNNKGSIIIFNRAAEKLTNYNAADILGKMNVADIYDSLEKARFVKKSIYSPEYGGEGFVQDFEVDIMTREGEKVPIRLSATLIYKDNREIGNVGFFHDITCRKELEANLRKLSILDGLSGLCNHRHFHTVLAEEFVRFQRYARPLSLICFDLDNFKQFNDNLGHLEGDNVIRFVGQNLNKMMRGTDQFFRYGGDEFMILMPETEVALARSAAERIRKYFNANWPFETVCTKSNLKPITLSLGVAEANLRDTPQTLIKRADLAMYEAKHAGGNCTVEAGVHK